MKFLLLLLSHLFLAAISGVMGHIFGLWAVWPIIFGPFLVYHSLYRPLPQTLLWALVLGYFTDQLTLAPTGFYMLLFSWSIALIHLVITVTNLPEPITLAIFAIINQLLIMLGSQALMATAGLDTAYPTTGSALFVPQLFLAALFTLLLQPWYKFIYRPEKNGYNGLEHKENGFIR